MFKPMLLLPVASAANAAANVAANAAVTTEDMHLFNVFHQLVH